jgi:exo-beta-1,3-glucanase (GH17 family)
MRLCLAFFAAVAVAIAGIWFWLGHPVAMPAAPLGAGEKLFCVSYAPFRGEQNPLKASTRIPAWQIEEDLAKLARVSNCVRTYSIEHGLDQVAPLAGKYGLKVMQGLWLSSHPDKNAQQVETVVALANRHRDVIVSVVVGNEVLLRGEMSPLDLVATVRKVKAAIPVPVTYADVWEFWLRHRELYDAVDFVTVHILPYWEDFPIPAAQAASHVDSIRARVVAAFPDKEVLIGETGWPSAGRMREGARPSPADQARVLHETLAAARRGGYRVNVIEAFDQPWKRRLEGTVGGYWGLYDDRTREPKFVWGAPVSNHPHWPAQALLGVALAAAVFASAWWGVRAGARGVNDWLAVAAIALVAGALIGWTGEKTLEESLGFGGWLRSLALAGVAVGAPVVVAHALMRGFGSLSFAALLGGADHRNTGSVILMLGGCLIVLTAMTVQTMLGLVFDPRYKDFPFTALLGAVFPFLVLSLRRRRGVRQTAERVAAAVLALSAGYVALNEGFANWQALATVAATLGLAITLLRGADAPRPG